MGQGNIISEFIYGTKATVPDLVIRAGATYRVVSDQLGSPVLAINTANSSDVPFQATYTAFGERTLVAGTDDWMPLGFAGGIYDPDTKLSRFGDRDYDSSVGRWVSKDPILFDGQQANLYVYVGNDPIQNIDDDGHALRACFNALMELAAAELKCEQRRSENVCPDPGHDKAISECENRVQKALEKVARHCTDRDKAIIAAGGLITGAIGLVVGSGVVGGAVGAAGGLLAP